MPKKGAILAAASGRSSFAVPASAIVAHYDVGTLNLSHAHNEDVTSWPDLSVNANHLNQAWGVTAPKYEITASAWRLGVVNSGQGIGVAASRKSAAAIVLAQPFTILFYGVSTGLARGAVGETARGVYIDGRSGGRINAGSSVDSQLTGLESTPPQTYGCVFNGASSTALVGATIGSSINPGTGALSSELTIGGDNGSILAGALLAAVLVMNRAITQAELTALNTYWSARHFYTA